LKPSKEGFFRLVSFLGMKYIYLILTLAAHLVVVTTLKLSDNLSLIVVIFSGCLLIGLIIKYWAKEKKFNDLGWGLLLGSLTSLTLLLLLFVLAVFGTVT